VEDLSLPKMHPFVDSVCSCDVYFPGQRFSEPFQVQLLWKLYDVRQSFKDLFRHRVVQSSSFSDFLLDTLWNVFTGSFDLLVLEEQEQHILSRIRCFFWEYYWTI
jgi:hypothetical protein